MIDSLIFVRNHVSIFMKVNNVKILAHQTFTKLLMVKIHVLSHVMVKLH